MYQITSVNCSADVLSITLQTDVVPIGNIMLFVDGAYLIQHWGPFPTPMSWTEETVQGIYTARINLPRDHPVIYRPDTQTWDKLRLSPGQHTLTVSFWDALNTLLGYATASFHVPTRPLQCVVPGKILRTMFGTDPSSDYVKSIVPDLKAAGVNCISGGVFRQNGSSYADWLANYSDNWLPAELSWAAQNGFSWLAIGDDFLRSQQARDWITGSSWSKQAVQHVARMLTLSGIVVGIEMVDESWDALASDSATSLFVQWWRQADGPPMAWPNAHPVVFEKNSLADYSSRYWNPQQLWRDGKSPPYGPTMSQVLIGMQQAAADIPPGWPWLCEAGCAGPFYNKRVPGGDFQQGKDDLQEGGYAAQPIVAQMWLAMALGASGVRVYALDDFWHDNRINDPIGSSEQTGARPGDERWPGVVAGLNSLAKYEPLLLGQFLPPLFLDNWVIGRRQDFSWAINCSEEPEPLPITFSQVGETVLLASKPFWPHELFPSGAVVIL